MKLSHIFFNPMYSASECRNKKFLPWYLRILTIVAFLSGLLFWLMKKRTVESTSQEVIELTEPSFVDDQKAEQKSPTSVITQKTKSDDLTIIDGIGPVISKTLANAGIDRFELLAKMEVEALKKLLAEAKIRLNDPTTWPEQASYASRGDWEGLKKFQSHLKNINR